MNKDRVQELVDNVRQQYENLGVRRRTARMSTTQRLNARPSRPHRHHWHIPRRRLLFHHRFQRHHYNYHRCWFDDSPVTPVNSQRQPSPALLHSQTATPSQMVTDTFLSSPPIPTVSSRLPPTYQISHLLTERNPSPNATMAHQPHRNHLLMITQIGQLRWFLRGQNGTPGAHCTDSTAMPDAVFVRKTVNPLEHQPFQEPPIFNEKTLIFQLRYVY